RASFPQVHFSGGISCRVRLCACSATRRSRTAPARNTARSARGKRKCAFARTGFTTAPTAGKRAMLRWLTAVHTELRIISLRVDPDARLAAGAGGIARYLADSAGMASAASSELQAETVSACLQAFESLKQSALQIRYALYSDRIEIDLSAPDAVSARPSK